MGKPKKSSKPKSSKPKLSKDGTTLTFLIQSRDLTLEEIYSGANQTSHLAPKNQPKMPRLPTPKLTKDGKLTFLVQTRDCTPEEMLATSGERRRDVRRFPIRTPATYNKSHLLPKAPARTPRPKTKRRKPK
jgi:hypothetical protein